MKKDRLVVAALVGWLFAGLLSAAPQGHALRLGPDTRLVFPHDSIMHTGDAATIEFWCRSDGSQYGCGWDRYLGSQEHKGLSVTATGSVDYIYAGSPWHSGPATPGAATGGVSHPASGAVPADSQWHHVAFVRRANATWSIYVDGVRLIDEGPGSGLGNGCWLTCNVIEASAPTAIFGASATLSSWDMDELRVSSVEQYSGATFTPQRFFTAGASTVMHLTFDEGAGNVVNDSGPAQQQGAFTSAGTPSWVWVPASLPSVHASGTSYGVGCGSPPLLMSGTTPPVTGAAGGATITNAPTVLGGVAIGRDNTTLGGLPILPLSLASLGMPGCELLHSNEIFGLAVTSGAAGTLNFSYPIPNNYQLLGQHFYLQAYCYAPGANQLELIASNGIDWLIGNQ